MSTRSVQRVKPRSLMDMTNNTDHNPEGTPKPDGLGENQTIPNTEDGIALGHDPDGSNFNQEEDVEHPSDDA